MFVGILVGDDGRTEGWLSGVEVVKSGVDVEEEGEEKVEQTCKEADTPVRGGLWAVLAE